MWLRRHWVNALLLLALAACLLWSVAYFRVPV